jgi:hypothetical protein
MRSCFAKRVFKTALAPSKEQFVELKKKKTDPPVRWSHAEWGKKLSENASVCSQHVP